jgi:hypothetical protein
MAKEKARINRAFDELCVGELTTLPWVPVRMQRQPGVAYAA